MSKMTETVELIYGKRKISLFFFFLGGGGKATIFLSSRDVFLD